MGERWYVASRNSHSMCVLTQYQGLFPPGTLPAPGDELYLRNKEKWYNTYSSAKHWDEMPSE